MRPSDPDDLAGIHDVLRIDRKLDRPHDADRIAAVLRDQEIHFAAADPVLPGAGAAERDGAVDQSVVQFVRPVHLVRDGESVGRTQIELVAPGEPFSVGWGSHDSLRVVRRTDHRTDRTLLRGTHVHTFDTRLRLSHLGSDMVTVHITERVPVSELTEVSVSLEDVTPPATGPDRDGFLTWELVLHPGDQQTITLTTQVKAASRVVLPF